eukprot:scaffold211046_cov35-Tisochrysis_lutea.AAC.2
MLAKPERTELASTAPTPISELAATPPPAAAAALDVAAPLISPSCTSPTPTVSNASATHWTGSMDWPRIRTKKRAVKSVFDCDHSWCPVAESRERATNNNLFCSR